MTLLDVVYYSHHPALHKTAEPITTFDDPLKKLVADMIETMYAENGCGLAAPQVGISKRLAVVDISEKHNQPFCIINPEIIEKKGIEDMEAGCLSVPGTYGKVPRALYIKMRAQNEMGEFFEMEADGLLSHCLQHEIDHLYGKVYIDYFSPLKKSIYIKKMEKHLKWNKTR